MKKLNRNLIIAIILVIRINVNASVSNISLEGNDGEIQQANDIKINETEKAFQLLELVQSENRFIDKLKSEYIINLPVGIASKDPKKGEKYTIIISDLIIRNGQTYINAYMAFMVPGSDKKLAFKGSNIPLSFTGGIKGNAKLELISDVEVDISKHFSLKINGEGATYVSFDCDGFKEMALDAVLEFDSTLFVPENPDGTQKNDRLSVSFKTVVADWNDLIISVSLDPFQLKPLKGVGFTVTKAILDLSDSHNSSDITFPENYKTDYFADDNENIWRGFYIEDAEVRLPKYFKKGGNANTKDTSAIKKSGSNDRITLFAHGLLVDELGFTAEVGANNVLSLDDGKIGKWAFSLDSFAIKIESSQLISGNFKGQIKVPEFKGNNLFNYSAQMGLNNSYAFQVSVADSLEMNLWMAKLMLEPNSALNIELKEDQFVPTLDLNGVITINAPTDKTKPDANKLALAKIPFQGMHIQNEAPYFSVDYISFGTEQNLFSKFPVSIDELNITCIEGRVGLKLGLNVNFTSANAGGLGGKGGFTVWAKRGENSWEYDGIDIDKIKIDIAKPDAFEFHGSILFIKGDSIYGSGFKGQIDAKFAKYGMTAVILFGNVNGYRYWYADALATIATGIPAGPISIYGFGGGAYYNMEQTGINNTQASDIGKSSSGIVYNPKNSGVLGILASVKLGMTSAKNSFNGDVKLEMTFNSSGGINNIYFTGNGYFMTGNFNLSGAGIMDNAKGFIGKGASGTIPKDGNNAQINGTVNMQYDFNNNSFYSTLDLYVNVAGGKITGTGAQNKAGTGVISIRPDDWYIKLGTPQNPNEVKILDFATMNNYFMAGKTIPEMPSPPDNVKNSLGSKINDYYNQRNSATIPEGTGFAIGAKFTKNSGDKTCWIFFGNFDCTIGFDMLLKNYGSQSVCSGGNEALGINGWYAQGQAYAWISAKVGMDVDVLVYKGRITIFEASMAALLTAKAPNPSWMMGNVSGHYDVLGGWVSGNFSFDFELGKQCTIVERSSQPLTGISIISAIYPGNGLSDIDVFTNPQITFNTPAEKEFNMRDEKNISHTYRLKINKLAIKKPNGTEISGSRSWNDDHTIVTFKPNDLLPSKTKLTTSVEVYFEEKLSSGWVPVTDNNKTLTETKELSFTTGNSPDHITAENIDVSYPQIRQFNYYRNESNVNFLKFKIGQPELFKPGNGLEQKVKIEAISGTYSKYTGFSYDTVKRQVNFSLPDDMPNNTIFRLKLVNRPIVNPTTSATSQPTETVFFSTEFRTSKYNTFAEKISNLSASNWSKIVPSESYCLSSTINGEFFDGYEIGNFSASKQLSVKMLLEENDWYKNVFLPATTFSESSVRSALHATLTIPSDAIVFNSTGDSRILTYNEIQSGYTSGIEGNSEIKNYTFKYIAEYYKKLQVSVASINTNANWYKNLNSATKQKLSNILVNDLTIPPGGNYAVTFYYTIPGKTTSNSIQNKNIMITE